MKGNLTLCLHSLLSSVVDMLIEQALEELRLVIRFEDRPNWMHFRKSDRERTRQAVLRGGLSSIRPPVGKADCETYLSLSTVFSMQLHTATIHTFADHGLVGGMHITSILQSLEFSIWSLRGSMPMPMWLNIRERHELKRSGEMERPGHDELGMSFPPP